MGLSNGTMGNFLCHSRETVKIREGERERKGSMCLRENLYLGLISHALAEWRIFFLYRSLCQILPTHGRPRGTLRTYASPRFAFQPTSLQRSHPSLSLPPLASLCRKIQVSILEIKSQFVGVKLEQTSI